MGTNTPARIAAILVGLEGLALVALAVWQIVAIVQGDTGSIESALALLVLTAVGASALLAFAVAVFRGRSWGRSGGIVFQVLILAVALGATTGAYAHPLMALAIAVPAIAALVLLILAARDAGRAKGEASESS
ncbi:histidine kinase [Microbacterium immunditiarum]|uniref:Putative membrane protein n=1 Tax=Microbacterium immunditiarum TaxID=337480 RepID=A0A7Y9GQU8_9MICO|nr:histidine kinase [Microbacterium immunditiarum]NYE20968.1 putative membrane protein [Microbacterium immunditiarum]